MFRQNPKYCDSLVKITNWQNIVPLLGKGIFLTPLPVMKKSICLSFDDGPSKYTTQVLNTLDQYNAKATFFICGEFISDHVEQLVRMNNSGHSIGLHSFGHANITSMSKTELIADIKACENELQRYGIKWNKIYRPPYGEVNAENIATLKSCGYDIYLWSADYSNHSNNVNQILEKINKLSYSGELLLFHDGPYSVNVDTTIDILHKFLQNCRKMSINTKVL